MAVSVLAAACSDSHDQSSPECGKTCSQSNGAGGSAVQGGSDSHFDNPAVRDAGVHDAGASNSGIVDSGVAGGSELDAGLCDNLLGQAGKAVRAALAEAELGCTRQSDCQLISPGNKCAVSCGGDVLVSARGKARFQAVVAEQNAGACARFADAGCFEAVPPCPPLLETSYDCIAGKCSSVDDPMQPEASCLVRELSWTHDGGFVAFQDRQTLSPCRHFSLVRKTQKGQPADAHCANDVATDAQVTVADLNAALAAEDFNAALLKAPVLYGHDSRPVDGSVFRIEIDGATIDIGDDCNAEPGCPAIPAGVGAVRQVLEALTMQQRALGSCASLP